MADHEAYMRLALALARRPGAPPHPNPWVGCVIVAGGRIVGRGWHLGPGTPHAEAAALAAAGGRARGATAYVTLEPCCHFGRTPPCTDALVRAGIRRVVYAIRDPNPLVNGRGGRILRRHGIAVVRGVCAREARALNEAYLRHRSSGLPFVSVKAAASLDGKTATRAGRSMWITGAAARRRGRLLRAAHQAVLVGIGTVLADDPHLGPRVRGAGEPWRIVLDSRLRTPASSRVVASGRCIIACASGAGRGAQARLEARGARVWRFPGRRVPLRRLLARLARFGIISVLVEGGSEVLGSFIDSGLADRAYWFVAPTLIGSQAALSAVGGVGAALPSRAPRLRNARIEPAGDGWLVTGDLSRPGRR